MFFATFRRYLGIVLYRTIAGIKSEGRQNYLGYFWFLLEPALSTAVLYVVFTQIKVYNGGPHYIAFILIGMLTWNWFESSCIVGSLSIKMKFGVLNQYNLPKFIFPLVTILVNTWKFLWVFLIILIVSALLGYPPNIHFFYLPLIILLQFIWICALTMPLSIGVTLVNDLLTIVSSIFRILFYLSGVFFDPSIVPEQLRPWFYANPMAVIIEAYHTVILDGGKTPNFSHMLAAACVCLGFIIVGLALHYYYDKRLLKLTNV